MAPGQQERLEADEQEELQQPEVRTRLELAIERSYAHTTWAPLETSRWIPVRVPISTFWSWLTFRFALLELS